MDIKVIVATHKKYEMPTDEMYLPVQVGAALNDNIGYIGDNTGEHISLKNRNYCELTAIYWAWRNLEADAIGLVHYRRHLSMQKSKDFSKVLSKVEAENLLKKADIIVPKKRNYIIESNYSHYIHAHHKEPLDETRKIVGELYPEYIVAYDQVMGDTKAHMFNMFIMKKKQYDEYCEFLFGILFELEKRIDISSYDEYEARVFGFVSELLLDIWLIKNNYSCLEVEFNHMENEFILKKGINMILRKLNLKSKYS